MSTVVNNPGSNEGGGNGFFMGMVVFVIFVSVLLYFAIPALKNTGAIEVTVPAVEVNVPAPQVNVQAPAETETTTAK
ncbi:hypothetical protein KAZ57_02710 [Patescibacteria group bacterium]|nr:hypothetical protein [Patescibacteria group bacterium]